MTGNKLYSSVQCSSLIPVILSGQHNSIFSAPVSISKFQPIRVHQLSKVEANTMPHYSSITAHGHVTRHSKRHATFLHCATARSCHRQKMGYSQHLGAWPTCKHCELVGSRGILAPAPFKTNHMLRLVLAAIHSLRGNLARLCGRPFSVNISFGCRWIMNVSHTYLPCCMCSYLAKHFLDVW